MRIEHSHQTFPMRAYLCLIAPAAKNRSHLEFIAAYNVRNDTVGSESQSFQVGDWRKLPGHPRAGREVSTCLTTMISAAILSIEERYAVSC
jgi:hypothetical protein